MNPGETFEGFRIVRRLASGNMGQVFLAIQPKNSEFVALKVVQGGPDEEDRERIDFESRGARIQKDLASRDEHVVPVYDIFNSGQNLVIVMEYVDGVDLFTALKQGPFAAERAARHALSLSTMLVRVSQDNPLVHGDLKPRNILLTKADEVRVIDFGIAKILAESRPNTFNPYRSAPYSPPERLGTSHVDATSDLWAIGVILYEMIAGRHPYRVPNEDLRVRILQGPPDPLPASCPETLRNIILRMLSARPERRYQTAQDQASDLARFLAGHPVAPPLAEEHARMVVDPNATVRTESSTATESSAPSFPQPLKIPPIPHRVNWLKVGSVGVGMLVAVTSASSQYNVWNDSSSLARQLDSRQVNSSEAWDTYNAIEKRCKLPGVCSGMHLAMRRKLVEEADEVISDFRSDRPVGRLPQWLNAKTEIQRAISLGYSDNEMRGRLLLCDAHISRIRAAQTDRQRLLNRAESEFHDAMHKLPKDSFDAQLGLIPLYIYDLEAYDKGLAMIEEASKRGHPEGRREKVERADALRMRGEKAEAVAAEKETTPDRAHDYLTKAREDLESAIQYYQQAGNFTTQVDRSKDECYQHLKRIDDRLSQ